MMRSSVFITMMLLTVLTTACHKDKPVQATTVDSCGSDNSLNPANVVRKDFLKLSRVDVDFRIKACDGTVRTSRETVKDPKDAYSLSAQNLTADGSDYEVSAFNRTTCDHATIKPRKSTDPRMEIQFHTSPGTRRTHAKKNVDNYIDYEFRRCLKRDASNKCVSSEIAEIGTLVLFIDYSETLEPQVREREIRCPNPG